MTTKLKLRRDETPTDSSPAEARTLRFPIEAVSAMPAPSQPRRSGERAVAGRVRPSISKNPPSSDDLVRQIERTLDRVQERFDDLKGQIEEGYRISPRGSDDWDRPSAA